VPSFNEFVWRKRKNVWKFVGGSLFRMQQPHQVSSGMKGSRIVRRAMLFAMLLLVSLLFVFGFVLYRFRQASEVTVRVIGSTNFEGGEYVILRSPRAPQGRVLMKFSSRNALILYSQSRTHWNVREDGGQWQSWPNGDHSKSPPGDYYHGNKPYEVWVLQPKDTSQWQLRIDLTQTLRLNTQILLDLGHVTLVSPPIIPKSESPRKS
jgi:hypothetical protein